MIDSEDLNFSDRQFNKKKIDLRCATAPNCRPRVKTLSLNNLIGKLPEKTIKIMNNKEIRTPLKQNDLKNQSKSSTYRKVPFTSYRFPVKSKLIKENSKFKRKQLKELLSKIWQKSSESTSEIGKELIIKSYSNGTNEKKTLLEKNNTERNIVGKTEKQWHFINKNLSLTKNKEEYKMKKQVIEFVEENKDFSRKKNMQKTQSLYHFQPFVNSNFLERRADSRQNLRIIARKY